MIFDHDNSELEETTELESEIQSALQTYANPQPPLGLAAKIVRKADLSSSRRRIRILTAGSIAAGLVLAAVFTAIYRTGTPTTNQAALPMPTALNSKAVEAGSGTAYLQNTATITKSKSSQVVRSHIARERQQPRFENAFVFQATPEERQLISTAAERPDLIAALDKQRARDAQPIVVEPIQISSLETATESQKNK